MAKTNKVTVIEKNAGQKIDFEQSGTRLIFGDDELMLNAAKYQKDWDVEVDVCRDKSDNLTIGTGGIYTSTEGRSVSSTSIVLFGHTLLSASMERSKFAIVMSSLSYSMLQRMTVTSPMSSGFLSLCMVVFWFMPSPSAASSAARASAVSSADGQQIPGFYYSKYQNVVHAANNTEGSSVTAAYSLPGEDPAHDINFDTSRARCEAKGHGWHLSTNAEWAAIALWCKKNGFMPYGNNNYGKDTRESNYKAIPKSTDSGRTGRVATGLRRVRRSGTWSSRSRGSAGRSQ